MKCTYCGLTNETSTEDCSYCEAPLKKSRPKVKDFIFLDQCELSFKELCLFHTYDLLVLLRLVRGERSKWYNLMVNVKKGANLIDIDEEMIRYSESEYRRYTARMKLIEGILIDRMGYKPKRVDDKLLESLRVKIIKSENNGEE